MNLKFQRDKACQACNLYKSCTKRCIPTSIVVQTMSQKRSSDTTNVAILAIGEKPMTAEDKADAHFVGEAGKLFHGVYQKWLYQQTANCSEPHDLYVSNAVRCMTPVGATLTTGQMNACQKYLDVDIALLKKNYKTVLILAMGGPAAKSVGLRNQSAGFMAQGQSTARYGLRVFTTYNPAILMSKRDPAKLPAIQDHLGFLIDYLKFGKIPMETTIPIPTWAPAVMGCGTSPVAIDIETYGCVEGLPNQTVFHPVKSREVDKCPHKDLIQTIAASWRDGTGNLQAAFWVWPEHNTQLRSFLASVQSMRRPLLGMNTPFDLMFLRDVSPELKALLSDGQLLDLSIGSFLNSDVRPERSLKEISPLLRVSDYHDEINLKAGETYPRKTDPRLCHYNVKDAVSTLVCWERCKERTLRDYPKTVKFSDRCLNYYSDVLWTVIEMDENGVNFDRPQLETLETKLQKYKDRYVSWMKYRWDGHLCSKDVSRHGGGGSKAFIQSIVDAAVEEAECLGDRRLQRTAKKKEISTKKDNIHLILGLLPMGNRTRGALRIIENFRGTQKLLGSYIEPLLHNPTKGLVGDRAYPSWYAVPSREKDGGGDSGGTQQGRLTCKKPALQTCPATIKACMTTRFSPGLFLGADLSQIELRIGALLSGCPVLMGEYQKDDSDLHRSTAVSIFGGLGKPGSPEYKRKRHIGKTLNFLVLYKGGARAFQETLRRDKHNPMELSLPACQKIIDTFDEAHPIFRAWQDRLVEGVCTRGYMELPITGDSRTFRGSPRTIRETYLATICNFPIQTIAAWVMKSAQHDLVELLRREKLQTLMCLNVYDAVYLDVPKDEHEIVLGLLEKPLTMPAYYKELQEEVGRELPIKYDVEILSCRD